MADHDPNDPEWQVRAQAYDEITSEVITEARLMMEALRRDRLPQVEKIETVYADVGYPSCTMTLGRGREFPRTAWITVHCTHSQCYTERIEISVTLRMQGAGEHLTGEREFSLDRPIHVVQQDLKTWLEKPLADAAGAYLAARGNTSPTR